MPFIQYVTKIALFAFVPLEFKLNANLALWWRFQLQERISGCTLERRHPRPQSRARPLLLPINDTTMASTEMTLAAAAAARTEEEGK